MRNFTWNQWDFDGDGKAYIIAKDMCPDKEKVPAYIATDDGLSPACADEMIVQEGWCKFQVRSDWEEDSNTHGGYTVETKEKHTLYPDGRRKRGWFPVWIIRLGDWY